jgi:hypothetical protein
MGIEYLARPVRGSFDKVRNFLLSSSDFEILHDSESEIHFRWTSHPTNKQWPEDALIRRDSDQLYLLIHGSTGPQRETLLHDLNSLNLGGVFEEI